MPSTLWIAADIPICEELAASRCHPHDFIDDDQIAYEQVVQQINLDVDLQQAIDALELASRE